MVTNSLTLSKQRYFCVFKYIFCTFLTLFISFNLSANSIDEVFQVGKDKASAAQKSQIKIDGIADKTDALLQNYKQVNKEVEGLRVYNAQLEARIQNQIKRIAEIEEAKNMPEGVGPNTHLEKSIRSIRRICPWPGVELYDSWSYRKTTTWPE